MTGCPAMLPGQPDVVQCSECDRCNTVHAGGAATEEGCVFCGAGLRCAKRCA